ncbi:HAD-IIIC family phosphatase [Paenibacillus oleatilyticus]|uniref:HAD-IIIC family phosphatase n=1 Tax=Paenibacillus oleatilyticus TaxID=2594886 RepID=A0ABV4VA55_9BACL
MYANSEEFVKILRSNKFATGEAHDQINIVVISNITLEPLYDAYLKSFLLQSKINSQVSFLNMNEWITDIGSERTDLSQVHVVIVLPYLDVLNRNLSRNWLQFSSSELDEEVQHLQQTMVTLLENLRSQTKALILWNLFEIPYSIRKFATVKKVGNPFGIIGEINQFLAQRCKVTHNIIAVDNNFLFTRFGAEQMYDRRLWSWIKMPYSKKGCFELTRHFASYITSFFGKGKKCLVLDCDDVLWGGILGEEGIGKIKLSPDFPGSPYYEFQEEVLNLYTKGILIALCSKNNESDVLEVLNNHPHMLLREQHLAAYEVNWEEKSTNIIRLADKLNISLDSMIFMDDSEFEINLVRHQLPEVKSVLMPNDKPYLYRDILLDLLELNVTHDTEEDSKRTLMYQDERRRREEREVKRYTSTDEYYRSLQMIMDIRLVNELSILRVAQLTQKTNQFNLTGLRCTEDDICQRSNDPNYDVIIARLRDRFGDMGIIGAAIIHYANSNEAVIENFILSCRAIGRSAERVLLQGVMERARQRGISRMIGSYKATPKNQQTENFYDQHGFSLTYANQAGKSYVCNPQDYILQRLDHFMEYTFF